MMNNRITEGYMPFMGYQTYYRIVGKPSEKAPLLLLHGGSGSTHNYFEVLAEEGLSSLWLMPVGLINHIFVNLHTF